MRILGIETSCDETGVAIYDEDKGLIANQLYTQIALHADYGGVVPELASRDHIRKTAPLIKTALAEANLTADQIDGIAYTSGPGLVGALLVGATMRVHWLMPGMCPLLVYTTWKVICLRQCLMKTDRTFHLLLS